MKKFILLTTLGLLTVSGCAKRADSVVPVDIPIAAYSNHDCAGLARELLTEREKLTALTKRQNQAATGDAVGVFLLGVPTASVTGHDKEGELAVSKGKVLSIENSISAKACNTAEALPQELPVTAPAIQ